jgi:hypothetical protein
MNEKDKFLSLLEASLQSTNVPSAIAASFVK